MLQLVVPRLISSFQSLPEPEATRLPAFRLLQARGLRDEAEAEGVEALLCRHFGIAKQADWPLAAISFVFDNGRAGGDYWLRADPVQVQVHRDRLILLDQVEISADEAQTLCDALASHFGDVFTPLPMHPTRWYVRVPTDPGVTTTPLSLAIGKSIDRILPNGQGAMHWRKLLNEAQMLLFSHPVNQARESRGLPPINSIWLWGGGTLPAAPAAPHTTAFYGRDFTARAVAKFSNAAAHALPECWRPGISDPSLCLIDQISKCWQDNDVAGWITALGDFETGWLSPLMKAGKTFRVEDPVEGASLSWHPLDRWKVWRRAKPVRRSRLDVVHAAPEPYSGTDEFGNRY
jgi:hypothetical protein